MLPLFVPSAGNERPFLGTRGQDNTWDLVSEMTQEAMRRLRFLGPASVERIPKTWKNSANSAGDGRNTSALPRFRSKITITLFGYLVAGQRSNEGENLAMLFWSDVVPIRGCGNLRRELHNLA